LRVNHTERASTHGSLRRDGRTRLAPPLADRPGPEASVARHTPRNLRHMAE